MLKLAKQREENQNMKIGKILAMLLSCTLMLSLCACTEGGGGTASGKKGTRSNPYQLRETFTITASEGSDKEDKAAEYTVTITEVWDGVRLKEEYPHYTIEDSGAIRGSISVSNADTEDALRFALDPILISESMNEDDSDFKSFVPDNLNSSIDNVYDGGTYDVIALSHDIDPRNEKIAYVKIEYYDKNHKDAFV